MGADSGSFLVPPVQILAIGMSPEGPAPVRTALLMLDGSQLTQLDDLPSSPRRYIIPVQQTLKELLEREDTDGDMQITIDDAGPKVRPRILEA